MRSLEEKCRSKRKSRGSVNRDVRQLNFIPSRSNVPLRIRTEALAIEFLQKSIGCVSSPLKCACVIPSNDEITIDPSDNNSFLPRIFLPDLDTNRTGRGWITMREELGFVSDHDRIGTLAPVIFNRND